jgi:hypothetical protein
MIKLQYLIGLPFGTGFPSTVLSVRDACTLAGHGTKHKLAPSAHHLKLELEVTVCR